MSQLIELRHYIKRYTLQDAYLGINPSKHRIGDKVEMFSVPELQYRTKEKVDGKVQWSPWQPVLFVREGDDVIEEAK